MDKASLRKEYLVARKNLTRKEILQQSARLCENFLTAFQCKAEDTILAFLPIEKFSEPDLTPLIHTLWKRGTSVFLPRVQGENLEVLPYTTETVCITNSWGIPEPEGPAADQRRFTYVLTPLLYCDAFGNRVGYGKGFYDKLFSRISAEQKVGISFFPPGSVISDYSVEDVRLDALVTPESVLFF